MPTMLPVPTVWAWANGEAHSKRATANSPNRTAKQSAELKFKIANLPFGIFTEPLSTVCHYFSLSKSRQHFAL